MLRKYVTIFFIFSSVEKLEGRQRSYVFQHKKIQREDTKWLLQCDMLLAEVTGLKKAKVYSNRIT
jgi:hypothetical protein